MRKLMIAMLALAVVFGFAACDNSNSGSTSLMDKYVVALEVTDGPKAYFDGQKVDVADYTITATRNDGSTFVVAANELAFSNGAALTANEGNPDKTIGTIAYTGIYVGTIKTPSVAVEADVYEVDAITVEVAADQQTYYATNSSLKNFNDGYTVTAYAFADDVTDTSTKTAEDALYYAVLDSKEFVINTTDPGDIDDTKTFSQAGLKDLSFKVLGETAAETESIKDGKATAQLVVQADYVADFSVAQITTETAKGSLTKGTNYKYAVVGGKIDKTATKNAQLYLVVTETMASGKTVTQVGSAIEDAGYTVSWGANISDDTFAENGKYAVTVKGVTTAAKTETTKPFDVVPVKNEVEAFTITPPTTIKAGDKIDAEDCAVSITSWLDDGATKTDKFTLLIDGSTTYTVPNNYPAETQLLVKLTLQEYPNATTTSKLMTSAS